MRTLPHGPRPKACLTQGHPGPPALALSCCAVGPAILVGLVRGRGDARAAPGRWPRGEAYILFPKQLNTYLHINIRSSFRREARSKTAPTSTSCKAPPACPAAPCCAAGAFPRGRGDLRGNAPFPGTSQWQARGTFRRVPDVPSLLASSRQDHVELLPFPRGRGGPGSSFLGPGSEARPRCPSPLGRRRGCVQPGSLQGLLSPPSFDLRSAPHGQKPRQVCEPAGATDGSCPSCAPAPLHGGSLAANSDSSRGAAVLIPSSPEEDSPFHECSSPARRFPSERLGN